MEGKKTVLYNRHVACSAKMVDFAGWQMPIQYEGGIVQEHLATRRSAGLFDVSHMGRFLFRGCGSIDFLQRVLTNDVSALQPGDSHYTLLAAEDGSAIDDAWLYRYREDAYLLVVNASNRQKDWDHLSDQLKRNPSLQMIDVSDRLAMISLQGPRSEILLQELIENGVLPEAKRNRLSIAKMCDAEVYVARTGYTGESICFELIAEPEPIIRLWDSLVDKGAVPVGLGARDTLRLEAGLPLYGHEYGMDPDGKPIPILSCPASKFGISFAPHKGQFVGRKALKIHADTLEQFDRRNFDDLYLLPRRTRSIRLHGSGIARAGDGVNCLQTHVGYITSGTMVPYWKTRRQGDGYVLTEETGMRAIAIAMLDSTFRSGDTVEVMIRGREVEAIVVARNLDNRSGPITRAIVE
jgi:aminomethyltransferase